MPDKGQKFYISQLFTDWNKPKKGSKVQMNPRTAVLGSEERLKMQQLTGLTALLIIFFGFGIVHFIARQPSGIQATFNFSKSVVGKVSSVDPVNDEFTITYQSSIDQAVINTKKSMWNVALVPGKSISKSNAADHACYLIGDLTANLKYAVGTDCNRVITVGRTVFMDYVFLNVQKGEIVVSSIIGQK